MSRPFGAPSPSVFVRAVMDAREHYVHCSPCCRADLRWDRQEPPQAKCSACHRGCSAVMVLRRGGGRPETVERVRPIPPVRRPARLDYSLESRRKAPRTAAPTGSYRTNDASCGPSAGGSSDPVESSPSGKGSA